MGDFDEEDERLIKAMVAKLKAEHEESKRAKRDREVWDEAWRRFRVQHPELANSTAPAKPAPAGYRIERRKDVRPWWLRWLPRWR